MRSLGGRWGGWCFHGGAGESLQNKAFSTFVKKLALTVVLKFSNFLFQLVSIHHHFQDGFTSWLYTQNTSQQSVANLLRLKGFSRTLVLMACAQDTDTTPDPTTDQAQLNKMNRAVPDTRVEAAALILVLGPLQSADLWVVVPGIGLSPITSSGACISPQVHFHNILNTLQTPICTDCVGMRF